MIAIHQRVAHAQFRIAPQKKCHALLPVFVFWQLAKAILEIASLYSLLTVVTNSLSYIRRPTRYSIDAGQNSATEPSNFWRNGALFECAFEMNFWLGKCAHKWRLPRALIRAS